MYTIQANEKGSREIAVSDEHLNTIERYALLADLIPSHGIVTEETLEKLRMNVRSLIEANPGDEELLSLCRDVLFHDNMKAFALHQLTNLFLHR